MKHITLIMNCTHLNNIHMKTIRIIILAMIVGNLQAQTIKSYSGDLDNGKVTFSYYEDSITGKEIRHGNYKYVYSQSGDYESKYSVTITGNYINGFRNGIWNYTVKKMNNSDGSNEYYTGATTMIQSYSEGMPSGIWSYSENYQVRSQIHSAAGWSWGAYKNVTPQNITVNFCNGVLCGSLKINTTFEKITGQLSNNGLWIGTWNINSKLESTLENGIVMKYKIRDDAGNISSQSTFDQNMMQSLNIIKTLPKDSIEGFCIKNNLKCELILGTSHYNFDCFDASGRYFNYQKTDGDKTIVYDEYGNTTDKRNYGCFYLIERMTSLD